MAFMEGLDNIANPKGGDERLGGGNWAKDEDRSYGNNGNQTYDEWMQSLGYAKGSYGHNDGYLEWRQANTPEGQSFVYQGNEYTGTGIAKPAKPKEAESVSESNKETITEGIDFSWVLGSPDVDSETTYTSLAKEAENAPMYAKAGLSTELNNPNHEETKKETMENEIIPFATAEELATGWKNKTKKGNTKEELEKAQKELDADNKIGGFYTADQLKRIDEAAKSLNSDLGDKISKVANVLTMGIAPTTQKGNFTEEGYKSAIEAQLRALDHKPTTQEVNDIISKTAKMAANAQAGLLKDDIDYYKLTGDSIGDYSQKVDTTLQNAMVDVVAGNMTMEQYTDLYNSITEPTNKEYLNSIWQQTKGMVAFAAGTAAGKLAELGISKLAPKVVEKALSSDSKVAQKIIEKIAKNPKVQNKYKFDQMKQAFEDAAYAESSASQVGDFGKKLADALVKGDKAAVDKIMIMGKEPETLSPLEDIMFDLVKQGNTKAATEFAKEALSGGSHLAAEDLNQMIDVISQLKTNPAEYADWFVAMSKDLGYANPTEMATAVASAISENESVKKGLAATGITTAAIETAKAAPTGTFDTKGRMIDSKEIVKERLNNPYPGEDAVELKSREGVVTVSPREAVIIGEAENLTPTQNYTDEVKKAAEGSEVYNSEGDVVYNGDEPEKIQPEIVNTNWFDKTVDVIQAMLGGRDQNNDRTITAQEWYTSTLKKPVEAVRDFAHLPDLKSKLNHLKDVANNYIERIGIALESSAPAVIDLSTGKVEVVDKEVPYTEDLKEAAKTAVIDSLPKWSDDSKTELVKEAIADGASAVLGEYAYGAGNFIGIQAAKAAGSYVASTVKEICHLMGYDMDNDQVGALNMLITNVVGIFVAPTSTIVRDLSLAYGGVTREGIESIYKNAPVDNVIIPLDKDPENWKSEPVSINDKVTKDSEADYSADFGTTTEVSDDPNSTIDDKYSGYVEQAKNSNLAKNYNYGMEQKVNETVSDKDVKGYIVTLYSKEPEWMRKAIAKVLAAHSEREW